MKNIRISAIVATVAVASILGNYVYAGCGSCGPKATEAKVEKKVEEKAVIDTHTLQVLLNSGTKLTVLDARSGKWDNGRRIPGAKSLAADATAKDAAKLIPSKDSLVIAYCSSKKCPASAMLSANLKKLGYTNILEYSAGIDGWTDHGNSVEKAK